MLNEKETSKLIQIEKTSAPYLLVQSERQSEDLCDKTVASALLRLGLLSKVIVLFQQWGNDGINQ